MTEAQILEFAIKSGIISLDTIQAEVEMKQREEYLKMHRGKIWQGSGGYWYTELPATDTTKRRLVKKKEKTNLENAIIAFYETIGGCPTVQECFEEWSKQKLERNEICKGTFDRYENDFKRFFADSYIVSRKIDMVTEIELEDFVKDSISEHGLTAKAYGNLRTLIIGTFKYAKKHGYTTISISEFFGDLELSRKAFTKPEKKPQVFRKNGYGELDVVFNNNLQSNRFRDKLWYYTYNYSNGRF